MPLTTAEETTPQQGYRRWKQPVSRRIRGKETGKLRGRMTIIIDPVKLLRMLPLVSTAVAQLSIAWTNTRSAKSAFDKLQYQLVRFLQQFSLTSSTRVLRIVPRSGQVSSCTSSK